MQEQNKKGSEPLEEAGGKKKKKKKKEGWIPVLALFAWVVIVLVATLAWTALKPQPSAAQLGDANEQAKAEASDD